MPTMGVNRMKFISLATVPYILPFVKTELGSTWYKFTCWKLHICNGLRKSCDSMVDIQSATAEIRRGKKKDRKKEETTGNIMSASTTHNNVVHW